MIIHGHLAQLKKSGGQTFERDIFGLLCHNTGQTGGIDGNAAVLYR
jgi:hypothetical protein